MKVQGDAAPKAVRKAGGAVRRHLWASLAVGALALAGPAQAADLSVAPLYKAPAAPSAYNWNGFYAGLNAGGGWSTSNWAMTTPGDPITPFRSGSLRPKDFLGGGQVGFNWQSGSWVWGIEADADYRNSSDRFSVLLPSAPLPDEFRNLEARHGWLGTVRPRLGWAWGNALIYGTGGLAIGQVRDNQTLVSALGSQTFSSTSTRAGWTAGGGVEFGFAGNWSAKLEYLHSDLGSTNLLTPNVTGPGIAGFVPSTTTFGNKSDVVRAGINYRFGWDGPPVGR